MINKKINVKADDIFPIIKKFLYSDHEIFLRELISNATDAILKLKTIYKSGDFTENINDLKIDVFVNKYDKKIHIIDNGIGMTEKEINKYINQIAFSGAEEFVKKYNNNNQTNSIIGHFGLGFYSAFMVSDKVEIFTKSYIENTPGVHWICNGSPEFSLELINDKKRNRGTEVILHINDDSKEFLEEERIKNLLNKYCKFMIIPIKFGEKEEVKKIKDNEGKYIEKKIKVSNIVNNPYPAWTKKPMNLNDNDYLKFYYELYPTQFEDPLFWIHLNIDHPFNLTGILFFPKIKNNIEIQKDKIQLYQNQVYVTDNLEGIVPDFLIMLKGVIDSPDIPLNVSRSYLQSDNSVKKISNYISRKVADKLESIFKDDRKNFEKKWEYIKTIVEYGMISDENFYEKAQKFALYPNVDGEYFTFNSIIEKIKNNQKDKEGNIKCIYASNKDIQYTYIKSAKDKGYQVLLLNSPLTSHLINKIESKNSNLFFVRVDSDNIDKIIDKDINKISILSDEQKNILKNIIEKEIDNNKFILKLEDCEMKTLPFVITIPEFVRRMKEMNNLTGNYNNNTPESYNLIINTNHSIIKKIIDTLDVDKRNKIIKKSINLALISKNLLFGHDLDEFINNEYINISHN